MVGESQEGGGGGERVRNCRGEMGKHVFVYVCMCEYYTHNCCTQVTIVVDFCLFSYGLANYLPNFHKVSRLFSK